jgi:hypothetical protein
LVIASPLLRFNAEIDDSAEQFRSNKSHHFKNMKLEQQVASLELSKRLKELGVAQTGYFNWWQRICEGGDGWEWYPSS